MEKKEIERALALKEQFSADYYRFIPNNKTSGNNKHGGITARNFGGTKKNAITMQDKTGSYGQKRKPGDYLKWAVINR